MPVQNALLYASMMGILVKQEDEAGVEETGLTPRLHAITCAESSVTPIINGVPLERYAHAFVSSGTVPGKREVDLSIKVPLVGGYGRPGYEDVPIPQFDPLIQCSGFRRTLIRADDFITCVKSAARQTWDFTDLSPVIRLSVREGAAATYTLDIANATKYPDRSRVTAAQVVADLSAAMLADDVQISAYRGHIYLRLANPVEGDTLEVLHPTSDLFQFPMAGLDSGWAGPFNISAGATIAFAQAGDVDDDAVVLTLDHNNAAKYPDNQRATAREILEDVGSASGGRLFSRNGRLYIRSSETATGATIRVVGTARLVQQFTRTATVAGTITPGDEWTLTITPDGGSPIVGVYTAGGGDTAQDVADGLDAALNDAGVNAAALLAAGISVNNTGSGGQLDIVWDDDPGSGTTLLASDGTGTPGNATAQAYLAPIDSAAEDVFGFQVDMEQAALVESHRLVTRVDYEPDSYNAQPTLTLHCYMFPQGAKVDQRAYLIRAKGCVFDHELMTTSEGESFITFTGKGAWVQVGDTDVFPKGWKYTARTDALVAIGATVLFDDRSGNDSREEVFTQMTFKGNYEVVERGSQSGAGYGIKGFMLDRKGTSFSGSFNPEARMHADFDRYANVAAAVANRLDGVWFSAQGSVFEVYVGDLQFGSPTFTKAGTVKYEQEFFCRDETDDLDNHVRYSFRCLHD